MILMLKSYDTVQPTAKKVKFLRVAMVFCLDSSEDIKGFSKFCVYAFYFHMDRVKRIWYLSPMRAAKVQASLRIRAVSPEPSLLA